MATAILNAMKTGSKAARAEDKAAQRMRQTIGRRACSSRSATRPGFMSSGCSPGDRHVGGLCEELTQSQPAVSHHLALLRLGGLIERRRRNQAQHLQPHRHGRADLRDRQGRGPLTGSRARGRAVRPHRGPTSSPAIPPSARESRSGRKISTGVDLKEIPGLETPVNNYPANEQRISDVERGRISNAVLPMPPGRSLCVGDTIVFALAYSPASQDACFVSEAIPSVSPSPRSRTSRQSIRPPGKPSFGSPGSRSVEETRPDTWPRGA